MENRNSLTFEDEDTNPGLETRRGARIIVADDDPEMRHLMALRLADRGYEVCESSSGTELLRMLERITCEAWPLAGVDLIVLDQRMPGLPGVDAMQKLRTAHWTIPAILVTAFPDQEVRRRAASLGMWVLAKPFSLDELTDATRCMLLSKHDDPSHHAYRVPRP